MKKQLLFTAILLFATGVTFGQATVLDPLDSETQQISIASTDYTQTGGPLRQTEMVLILMQLYQKLLMDLLVLM